MNPNMNIPALNAAAAASFHKSQEVANEQSTEARDKKRLAREMALKIQAANEDNKTQGTKKGFLA